MIVSSVRAVCLAESAHRPLLCRLDCILDGVTDQEIIFTVTEAPEGGYEARALGHSIFTEGDSMDELKEMVQDAVRCHFDEGERPRVIRLHFVRDEVIPA